MRDKRVVNDVAFAAPVWGMLHAETIDGVLYTTHRRKSIPLMGPRPANFGMASSEGAYERVSSECYHWEGRIEVDPAIEKAEKNPGEIFARNAKDVLEGGLLAAEFSLIYGTALSKDRAPGFLQSVGPYMTISAKSDYRNLKKGDAGYDAAVADNSGMSVWFIVNNDRRMGIQFGNQAGFHFGQIRMVDVPRKTHEGQAGEITLKRQNVDSWWGFACLSAFGLGRLKNVSPETGLTTDMLDDALGMFPAGIKPTHIIMNRKAQTLLKRSMTTAVVMNVGGKQVSVKASDVPPPTSYLSIPIVITDGILDDESDASIASLAAMRNYDSVGGGNL